jgi:deoxyribonuclease-4
MSSHELNIGYTTSLSQHMGKLIRLDGGNCGQFFTRSPQTFKTVPFNPNDWIEIKKDLLESQVNFVIHCSFLINFCKKQETINYVHKLIMEDMKICSYLNCMGVIIHMGKNVEKLPYEEAFQNYVQNIKYLLYITRHIPNKPILILETGAGQGTEIATDLTELGRLRKSLEPEEAERVGFCIDTCHIFTAGYDLRNSKFVDSLDAYIEMSLGWSNVKVIHLNDSQSKLNKKVDRHADISYGEITKTHKDCASFIKFIKLCTDRNIPLVLETPGDCTEYSKQISLVKGWCTMECQT